MPPDKAKDLIQIHQNNLLRIKINSSKSKNIFRINKYCKFWLESSKGLLSIKVKKVKKPTDNVIINRNITYTFFLIKSYILKK